MASLQKTRKGRDRRQKSSSSSSRSKRDMGRKNNRDRLKIKSRKSHSDFHKSHASEINSILSINQISNISKIGEYNNVDVSGIFPQNLQVPSTSSIGTDDLNVIADDLIGRSYRKQHENDEKTYVKKSGFLFSKKKSSSSRSRSRSNGSTKKDSDIILRIVPPVHRKDKYTKVKRDPISTRYTNAPEEWNAFQPSVLLRVNKPTRRHNQQQLQSSNRGVTTRTNNNIDTVKRVLHGSKRRKAEMDKKLENINNHAYDLYEKRKSMNNDKKLEYDRQQSDKRMRNAKIIDKIRKTGKSEGFGIGEGKQRKSRDVILSLNRLYRYDTQVTPGNINDSEYLSKARRVKIGLSERWNSSFRQSDNNDSSGGIDRQRFGISSSSTENDLSNKSDGELTWEQYQERYPTKQYIRESLRKIKRTNLRKERELKIDSISKRYAESANTISLERAHEELVNTMAIIATSRLYISNVSVINIHDPDSINTNVNRSIDIVDGYSDLSKSSLSRKNRPLWKSSPSLFNQSTPILYEPKNLREHCILLGWRSAILSIRKSLTLVSQCSDSRSVIEDEKRYFSQDYRPSSSSDERDKHAQAISYILYAFMIFENIIPNQMISSTGSIERFSATSSASAIPELNIEVVRSFAKICTVLIHNVLENKIASPILQFSKDSGSGNRSTKEQLDLKWLNCIQEKERDFLLNQSSTRDRYRGGVIKDLENWLFSHSNDIDVDGSDERFEFGLGDENYNRMTKAVIKEKEICIKGMDILILSKFSNILRASRAFTCMQCVDIVRLLDTHCWRSKHINVLGDINSLSFAKPYMKIRESLNPPGSDITPEQVMSKRSFCASEAHKMMKSYLDDTSIDTKIIADIYREYMPSLALKNLIYGICIQNECLLGLSVICDISNYESIIPEDDTSSSSSSSNDNLDRNDLIKSIRERVVLMNQGIYNQSSREFNDESEMIQTVIEMLSKLAPLVEELLIPQFGRRSIGIEMICWIMSYIEDMSSLYPAFKQIKFASYHSSDRGLYGDDVSFVSKKKKIVKNDDDSSDSSSSGSLSSSDSYSESDYSDDYSSDDNDTNGNGKSGLEKISKKIGNVISGVSRGIMGTTGSISSEERKFLKKQYDIRMTQNILYHGEVCSCLRLLLGFPEAMPSKYSRDWYRKVYKDRKLPKPEKSLKPSDFDSKQRQLFNKFGLIDKESIVFDRDRQKLEDRKIENELIANIRRNDKILQSIIKSDGKYGQINLSDLRKIDRLEYAIDPFNKVISSEQMNQTNSDIVGESITSSFSNAFSSIKSIFGKSDENKDDKNNIITWQDEHDKMRRDSSTSNNSIDHDKYQRFSRLFELENNNKDDDDDVNLKESSKKKILLRDNLDLPRQNSRIIPISERDIKSWEYLIGMNTIQIEEYQTTRDLKRIVDSFFSERDDILEEYDKTRDGEIPVFSIFANNAKSMMGKGITEEYNSLIENISKETNNIVFFLLKENGYFNKK